MKTKQRKNCLPVVQTTVWGISDESPSIYTLEQYRVLMKTIKGYI